MRIFWTTVLSILLVVAWTPGARASQTGFGKAIGYCGDFALCASAPVPKFYGSATPGPGLVAVHRLTKPEHRDLLASAAAEIETRVANGWTDAETLFYAATAPGPGLVQLRKYVRGDEIRYLSSLVDQQAALLADFIADDQGCAHYVRAPKEPKTRGEQAVLSALRKQPTFPRAVLDLDTHNAFPTVARLSDNTLIMAYRVAKQHHNPNGPNPNYTVKTYSFDDGVTWTKPVRIKFDGFSGQDGVEGLSVPTSGPLAGIPIMVTSSTRAGERVTRVAHALDPAGTTWAKPYLLRFDPANSNPRSIPSSAAIQVGDDEFTVIAYHTPDGSVMATRVSYSATGWRLVGTSQVAKPAGPSEYSEANATRTHDGRLLVLLRNEKHPSGQQVMGQATSNDGGKTWSKVTDAFVGYGLPHPIALSDGTLIVSYRKAANDSKPAMYRTSTDNGKIWSKEQEWGPAKRQMAYGWLVERTPQSVIGIWGKEDSGRNATINRTIIELPGLQKTT